MSDLGKFSGIFLYLHPSTNCLIAFCDTFAWGNKVVWDSTLLIQVWHVLSIVTRSDIHFTASRTGQHHIPPISPTWWQQLSTGTVFSSLPSVLELSSLLLWNCSQFLATTRSSCADICGIDFQTCDLCSTGGDSSLWMGDWLPPHWRDSHLCDWPFRVTAGILEWLRPDSTELGHHLYWSWGCSSHSRRHYKWNSTFGVGRMDKNLAVVPDGCW